MSRPGCSGGSCRQGRRPCTTPEVCRAELTRRVQEEDLRWSREIGYESARPTEPAQPQRKRFDQERLALIAACALAFIAALVMASI